VTPKRRTDAIRIASWCIAGLALLAVLLLHLLPALVAGLLVYELAQVLAPPLQRLFSPKRSRLVVVVLIIVILAALVAGAVAGLEAFFRSGAGSVPTLLQRLAEIVESARHMLPDWTGQWLPADVEQLGGVVSRWLREHAYEIRIASTEAARAVVQVLLGMAIGAIVAVRHVEATPPDKLLPAALRERAINFGEAFRRVVFAQVRISAINTTVTAAYLTLLLPVFGVHLPFTKTLIFITFVAGLLPVVGNLVSNTAIVLVSLATSAYVALWSLAFLVAVHKLEYFLNARIVGSRVHARAWELLIAMLVMESAFGLPGLVAAPIYYAYLKRELMLEGLV
jgi:predicted PurR-regulated permease PerM